jgi:hypothetical protein
VLDCDLTEEMKWGKPCFTYQKKNVTIVIPLKDACALSFFKASYAPTISPGDALSVSWVVLISRLFKTWELDGVEGQSKTAHLNAAPQALESRMTCSARPHERLLEHLIQEQVVTCHSDRITIV